MKKQIYTTIALCSLLCSFVMTPVIADKAKLNCGPCHSSKNCDKLPQPPTDTPASLEGQNCHCCFEKHDFPSGERNLNANKDCQSYDAMCALFCQPLNYPGIEFPAELTYTLVPTVTVPPCQKIVNPPAVENPLSLKGKNVLVIGGSKGIGKAIAERFRDEGAHVIATSRHPSCYEKPAGYRLKKLDVRFEGEVKHFINKVAKKNFHSKIDIIVNCAAIMWRGPLTEATGNDVLNIVDNNLAGYHRVVHYGVPYMHHSNETRVISIGSTAAYVPIGYLWSGYGIAKRALQNWNDSLQIEGMLKKAQGLEQYGPTFTLMEPFGINATLGLYEYYKASKLSAKDPHVLGSGIQFGVSQSVIGNPPSEVAEAVYRVAVSPQPSVRYAVSNPADVIFVPGYGLLPILELMQLLNSLPPDQVIQIAASVNAEYIAATQQLKTILTGAYCQACAASSQDNTQLKDNSYSSALSDLCNAIKQSQ